MFNNQNSYWIGKILITVIHYTVNCFYSFFFIWTKLMKIFKLISIKTLIFMTYKTFFFFSLMTLCQWFNFLFFLVFFFLLFFFFFFFLILYKNQIIKTIIKISDKKKKTIPIKKRRKDKTFFFLFVINNKISTKCKIWFEFLLQILF